MKPDLQGSKINVGALRIRIGYRGIIFYNYNKEPPKTLFKLLRPTLGLPYLGILIFRYYLGLYEASVSCHSLGIVALYLNGSWESALTA